MTFKKITDENTINFESIYKIYLATCKKNNVKPVVETIVLYNVIIVFSASFNQIASGCTNFFLHHPFQDDSDMSCGLFFSTSTGPNLIIGPATALEEIANEKFIGSDNISSIEQF